MRIIAGKWRGRRLVTPPGLDLRPTQDRVREALFSRLGDWVDGAEVVDLYAGSGAFGLEALSRGASHVTFVESSRAALKILKQNISNLEATDCTSVIAGDVFEYLDRSCDDGNLVSLLFADPPYGDLAAATAIRLTKPVCFRWAEAAVRVFENGVDDPVWPAEVNWLRWDERQYGKTRIVIEEKICEGDRT